MISTRRPVVGPQDMVNFVYLDGQFLWSDETHAELMTYLRNQGYDRELARAGQWGTVRNLSHDEVPNYVFIPQSDHYALEGYDPSPEMIGRLDALFPGITVDPPNQFTQIQDKPWGFPRSARLQGLPQSAYGPIPHLQETAQDYMENYGTGYNPPEDYAIVDPNVASQIAQAYDQAEHRPNDPDVQASYDAMKRETLAQYNHLVRNGYTFEFYPEGSDPYPQGPRQALEDLHHNKHLYVYPTTAGFGTENETNDHPLLEDSGVRWNGKPVTYNDVFRGVHDAFGHGAEGVGFRWDGEENAWRQHSSMYTDLARPAMTAETRGQNSWVNFGPHGEHNRSADQASTIYADQKATILPEWIHKTADNESYDELVAFLRDYFEVNINEGVSWGHIARGAMGAAINRFPGMVIDVIQMAMVDAAKSMEKNAGLYDAFIYNPAKDEMLYGRNHVEILKKNHGFDPNGNVYGWIHTEPLTAEIFSDFYQADQNPEPEALARATELLQQQWPGIAIEVPPQDVLDDINQTLGSWKLAIEHDDEEFWNRPGFQAHEQVYYHEPLDFDGGYTQKQRDAIILAPTRRDEEGQWWYHIQYTDDDGVNTTAEVPEDLLWPNEDIKQQVYDQLFQDVHEKEPVEQEEKYIGAPKFEPGESVIDKAFGDIGSIEWVQKGRDGWQYYIRTFDSEGSVNEYLVDEKDLERWSDGKMNMGEQLDQPGAWTMKDFGIPPEAEDYYRTSAYTEIPKPGAILELEGSYDESGQPYYYVCVDDGEDDTVALQQSDMMGIPVELDRPVSVLIAEQDWAQWAHNYNAMLVGWNPDYNKNPEEMKKHPYLDEYAEQWPDTIPWGEAEQNYYRNAGVIQFPVAGQRFKRAAGIVELVNIEDGMVYYREPDNPDVTFVMPLEQYRNFVDTGVWTRIAAWTKRADDDIMQGMDTSQATAMLAQQVQGSPAAQAAHDALEQAGGQVYVVGGAVRDAAMGKQPKDIDLMVQGLTPEQIQEVLSPIGRLDFTGAAFGVFRFKTQGDEVEIALPRLERSTGSGHKDFEINADPYLPPEEDLKRRDFTINAMAYRPASGEILDPHGGLNDLRDKRLALVNPTAFYDDPLRIVRALVATARYGFEPDPQLLEAMHQQASAIRHLPGERIQMEMDKLMSASDPAAAMEMAEQTGVLDYMAPEVASTVGFSQWNPHHDLDVWQHTLQVLRKAAQISNDPDVRLAALFHDSGKPDSFWRDPDAPEGGGGHFYKKKQDDGTFIGQDHEEVGGDLVRAFMERLRYPKKRMEKVEWLVRNHMFPYFDTAKGARKFLNRADGDVKLAYDLLALRQADASGKRSGEMNDFDTEWVQKARDLLTQVLEKDEAISIRDLAISGNDLIQMGMKPGPEIGRVLNRLLEEVIENPELNNRDDLLRLVNG